MRRILYKIVSKMAALIKPKTVAKPKELSYPTSTILLTNTSINFHTKRENRIYVKIGEKCLISGKFIFETEKGSITIGNNVHIGNATFICRTNMTVGNDVTMAWGITVYDHDSHSVNWEERKYDNENCYEDYLNHDGNNIVNKDWTNVKSARIVIGDKTWIGFDVKILKGVSIGEGAIIGAGAIVTKDVPAWTVVAGNPAVIVKQLENPHNI